MLTDRAALGPLQAALLGGVLTLALIPTTTGLALAQDSLEKTQAYIEQSERDWAEAVATGKTEILEKIIADDVVGVDSDGNQYGKAMMIAEFHEAPKYFASNHINTVKVRFFGNTAVAQGDETFERTAGEPKQARFVFTDTWVMRDGKWQVVATEALLAPLAAK